MSKYETPMTRWYWQKVGGTLIEEFRAVKRTKSTGQRLIDGVIVLGEPNEIGHWKDISIKGKDVISVQTKRGRLGMYLMGQTFFSKKLLERFEPKSVKAIALCEQYDDVLGPILEEYEGIEVVLYKDPES